ncbi:MAG: response regulator [Armatimonadetes bacterium]|nr:response regulator [Armatimonadota bacterium]
MEKPRILLVKEDHTWRRRVRRRLGRCGYQVATAGSVATAVARLPRFRPDLLLLDPNLPDGSGWEVARQIRHQTGTHVPILVCPGLPPPDGDPGAPWPEDARPGPFGLEALVERVQAVLSPAVAEASSADDREAAFFSSLSHDLRTPLTTLRTAVESLMADDVEWDEETRREFLAAILSGAEQVGRYAQDLLELARLDAGALRPTRQRIEPEETLEALARDFEHQPQLPSVRFQVAAGTPAAQGDPACVQRILVALVENALRCSPPGSEVVVALAGGARQTVWRVSDHGPGIPPAERELVFDRHRRVRGGRSAGKAPGISLYLCRELARLQGGWLWVEEAEGGGACFCLALPAIAR